MRELQKAAIREVERLLNSWGISVEWKEHVVGPHLAMDYGPDDVDVVAGLCLGERRFEIWVTPRDLFLSGSGVFRIVEWQDYPSDPEGQIRKFCEILQETESALRGKESST